MAIVEVSNNRGALSTATGGANPLVNLPAGASIAVGNTLLMVVSSDNSGTLGVDPDMWVVSATGTSQVYGQDLRGNYWWRIARIVRSSGAANDGAVAEIWACLVTTAFANADNITLQYAFPVANLNVRIAEYSGLNARSYSVVTAVSSTGNGTTIGPAATITPIVTGQMVVGVAAVEDSTALTGDADTTDGTWVTIVTTSVGAGATGNAIMSQRKITSGVTAQDWKITKAGAADWAALAVVFDAFTSVADGFLSGNPNYPCIAGAEILPLSNETLPVDTGTQYLQTHQIFPNSYGTQNYNVYQYLPLNRSGFGETYSHHTIIHEVFPAGAEAVVDAIDQEFTTVADATVGGGASVSSGTAATAIASVGGTYVVLPNGGYVDISFFMTNIVAGFPASRVIRWGIQYLAWKDDSAAPGPGEGMIAEWRDTGASGGAGAAATISAWLVQNYKRDTLFETRWVGEVNPIIRGKGEIFPQNAPYNAAFTVTDLGGLAAGGAAKLRLYGAQGADVSQSTVYLDYIQMIVEVVPERRLAQGTRLVSFAPTFVSSSYYTANNGVIPMWNSLNTSNPWQVPSSASPYVLGTREALPASPADYYANQVSTVAGTIGRTVGYNEALGPPLLLRAIPQVRGSLVNTAQTGQPVLERNVINGGVPATTIPEDYNNFLISTTAADLMRAPLQGSFWPMYELGPRGAAGDVIYTGTPNVPQIHVDGATTFDRVKVLVYPDELTTANLTITIEQPALTVLATATITPAQALTYRDSGSGWREISVALSVSVTPAAGDVFIRLASTTPSTAPWYIARASGQAFLGYYPTVTTNSTDRAAVLQCTLAAPTVTLGNSTQNIYRPTDRCLTATITLPSITLTNGALYNWVSIERTLDNGTTYTPVVLLTAPTNGQVYIDTAVPWDQTALTVKYRVTGYRNADHLTVATTTAGWNAVATAPGAAFGLAAPNGSLYIYVPVDESSLQVQWNPLNPVSLVPLFGVDYQIPLRAPEERGLSTSFLVLVDQLLVCTTQTPPWTETLSAGQNSMSPTPFDAIRTQAEVDTFSLVLPGGYRHFVTLTLGTLSIRTSAGLFLAETTLTDVPDISIDPWS